MPWLTAIVSSALVSAVVSGLVAGYFNLKALQTQYRNEYYKIVLGNRIEAYAVIDRVIGLFSTLVIGDNQEAYHLPFTEGMNRSNITDLMSEMDLHKLWVSDRTLDPLHDLNQLLLGLPWEPVAMMEFGKDKCSRIIEITSSLRRTMAADMLTLYDVPTFLKAKQKPDPVWSKTTEQDVQTMQQSTAAITHYTLVGRSGVRYEFEIKPLEGPFEPVGGLYIVCRRRPEGFLFHLATGSAENLAFSLAEDLAGSMAVLDVEFPQPDLVIGVLPADEQRRAEIGEDLRGA